MSDSAVQTLAVAAGPGSILPLIRSGEAVTRSQAMKVTGLSRLTVAQRLDALTACDYIAPAATGSSKGRRPPGAFQLKPDAGVMRQAAGRLIGESVAGAVSLRNRALAAEGGTGPVPAIPDRCSARSGPSALIATGHAQAATRKRQARSRRGGLMGAVQLVSDAIFAPPVVNDILEQFRQSRFNSAASITRARY